MVNLPVVNPSGGTVFEVNRKVRVRLKGVSTVEDCEFVRNCINAIRGQFETTTVAICALGKKEL